MRIGLGCMRLATEGDDPDEARAIATVHAALDGGVRWLDTARAYGGSEQLLARALEGRTEEVRIVTKCGMARPDGRWEPDGRASTILDDARASVDTLGRPPDVLLLHAPDPAVPLATSLRALERALRLGLTRAIGLSNVTRAQLDAAERMAPPLAAVEVALGAGADGAARGGVVAWCRERGIPVLAHSPLGGPARAARLARDSVLRSIATRHRVSAASVMLAYLLAVDASIVPLVGAGRPASMSDALRACTITLAEEELLALDARFVGLGALRRPPSVPSPADASAEVVILMGSAGAGKSRLATSWVARGYERLNRDTIGGTLRGLARRLDEALAGGATRLVLDNTYVTRAARSEVIRVAHARGAIVRCIHVDTPLREAEVNVTLRMLERHGELLGGAELLRRSKADPNLFAPTALFRMDRQLERPAQDEGFASIDVVPFARVASGGGPGVAVPLELVIATPAGVIEPSARAGAVLARALEAAEPGAALLVHGWRPGAGPEVAAHVRELLDPLVRSLEPEHRPFEVAICGHGAGPPVCWCRPPLPGLWVAFARGQRVDPRRIAFVVSGPAHRALAEAAGGRIVPVG